MSYKSNYSGPQIDSAVGRALEGGAIDKEVAQKLTKQETDMTAKIDSGLAGKAPAPIISQTDITAGTTLAAGQSYHFCG